MDWNDTPEQARFRKEIRTFIAAKFPSGYPPDVEREHSMEPEDIAGYDWPADLKSPSPTRRRATAKWTRVLASEGFVAPHWPKAYGGAGLTEWEMFVFAEEMAKAGVPMAGGIGVNLLGPTLIAHGSEEQRREHLPKILAGKVVWAQGFSEPGSGSDLASLTTRAVRDGAAYIVNGQKTWTSHAQYADWIFILARTDPGAPKHRGISFLMMDITTPGITVRPITDIRGGHPFNEVFFENVRVPLTNLVGDESRGWYVAMATLDFERSGVGGTLKYHKALGDIVALVRQARVGTFQHLRLDSRDVLRHELAQREIETRVLYNLALRTVSMQAAGKIPNHEASLNLLFGSELHQRLAHTGTKAFGLAGAIWQRAGAPLGAAFTHDYAAAVAHTVLSGTSEVQRNVIATRGLGLPRN